MLRTCRFYGPNIVRQTVAGQAQLIDCAEPQQTRIRRAVWRVTGAATFGLYRRMLVSEWTLLVGVAFNARRIAAGCQTRLLQLKPAVRVVTIAASHRAFQNFVMERHVELWLHFGMTTGTELRIVCFQHRNRGEARLFSIRGRR